jgi:Domain of unknown function (DUF5655)
MPGPDRPLWTCPKCGRSFAIRNQSHACLSLSADEHLADKTPLARAIYGSVVTALQGCGEFRVHAQKTRIAFISRMSFAGIRATKNWVDLSFIMPVPIDDERIRKLVLYGPTSWGHTVRITDPALVDAGIGAWLCEAWRRGNQETLDPTARVQPLSPSLLRVFETAFNARIDGESGQVVARLPGHIGQALAEVNMVQVRVRGASHRVPLHHGRGGSWVGLSAAGLVEGDRLDVYLRVV